MTVGTFSPAVDGDDIGLEASGIGYFALSVGVGYGLGHGAAVFYPCIRLLSTGIPQGATITSASLQLADMGSQSGGSSPYATFYGEDVDSPGAFGSGSLPSTRLAANATSASVTVTSSNQTDIDVTAIIQELVNRAGFSGNLALIAGPLGSGDYVGSTSQTLTDYDLVVDYTAGGSDVDVNASVESLTLTENAASISVDVSISAAVEALQITEYAATIARDVGVSVAVEALQIATYQAAVSLHTEVSAGVVGLQIAASPASIANNVEVSASVEALQITTNAAGVAKDVEVLAAAESLALTPYAASVARDVDIATASASLQITEHAAAVQFGENVQAGVVGLALAPQAAGITVDVGVQAQASVLSLATYRASVAVHGESEQQPGGFLPIIYLDRDGNEVSLDDAEKEVKQAAREAIKRAPRKERKELRKAVERVMEAPRLDLSEQIAAIRRELAQIDLMLVEVFEIRTIRIQSEYDDEAAFLLMVA